LQAAWNWAREYVTYSEAAQQPVATGRDRGRRTIRRLAATALLVSGLGYATWSVRTAPETYPVADTAATSLYALRAAKGDLATGAYSRFGWNHPGPLLYQVLGVPYALSGRREIALKWTALGLNVAWLTASIALAARRAPRLAICIAVALVPLLWREQRLLILPWNPFVPVLAIPLAVVLAAGLSRDSRWTAAALVGTLSFCVQSHVGLVPVCATILVVGLLAVVLGERAAAASLWQLPGWRYAIGAALIAWALPLAHEISASSGNLQQIARFLSDASHPRPSWGAATEAAGYMLVAPLFPSWHALAGDLTFEAAGPYALAVVAMSLASAAAALDSARRADTFEARFGWIAALCALVAPFAAARIVGPMGDYLLLWATGVGAMNVAVMLSLAASRVRLRPERWRQTAAAAATVATVCWLLIGAYRLVAKHAEQAQDTTIRALSLDFLSYCNTHGIRRPLLQNDATAWQEMVGIVLQFAKREAPIAVGPEVAHVVGPEFAPRGEEDAAFYLMPVGAPLPADYGGRAEWVTTRGAHRLLRIRREHGPARSAIPCSTQPCG
jgi:hypothetical protein